MSCCGDSESSPRLQFRRARGRDSAQVVTPFVQVGTYPTRNFATLGPLLFRPPFTGASAQSFALRLTSPLNLPAPGRRQCVYGALCGLARTCVFAKQSLGPILCGLILLPEQVRLPNKASLLPKLRDHYAEFLDHVSLVHLRLLASPTCVGLRYGRLAAPHSAFLARRLHASRSTRRSSLPSGLGLRLRP